MDAGRYVLPQGWETNSALEGYGGDHESDFRVGGLFSGRAILDEGYSGDNIYSGSAFHQELHGRDNYPPPPSALGVWPQARSYDEELAFVKESRRHEKPYVDSFPGMDRSRDIDKYREIDTFQDVDKYRDSYRRVDSYYDVDSYRDNRVDRPGRFGGPDLSDFGTSDYDYRHRISRQSRGSSHEGDYDYGRYSYDSDHERGRRESREDNWRRRDSRERNKRCLSKERDQSPYRRRHDRSRSRGYDDWPRSRSPRGRSHGRSHREDSNDDNRHERSERRRNREEKWHTDHSPLAPSATVVVKGLSQTTTEDDLCQVLAEWGPLSHVRVIKERNSGFSRGFAFIDFPSVGAACKMMDGVGKDALSVDGRKLFFEYSSKPTGGIGAPLGHNNGAKSTYGSSRCMAPPSDWVCIMCGCVNFARRISCFQCNEPRTDDAPSADVTASNTTIVGKKGSEAGPSHVLVVRGLDDNADEGMLRYEFSKHAPIKDLRLVRNKFTHVSKGFAFLHFHSVEDARKALEATDGTALEKNGQVLRVSYAKSIHGPVSGAAGGLQSSSLAAAAIEAATFAQQYDAVGWAPKEYNPDEKQSSGGPERGSNEQTDGPKDGSAPQSGFVWDEASGYYYDAASGFYYDGNTGLYYDSNNGTWCSYDHQTQQYVPYVDQSDKASGKSTAEPSKVSDGGSNKKVVISAPAITTTSNEKASLPDAVQAAAAAALAAEKKEREKLKELKLASKSSLLASKKKMNNVLTMWKQRNHGGQAARLVLDDIPQVASSDDRSSNSFGVGKNKKADSSTTKESFTGSGFASSAGGGAGNSNMSHATQSNAMDSQVKPIPISNSLGGTLMGVIRGSGRGVVKSDTVFLGSSSGGGVSTTSATAGSLVTISGSPTIATPFRTEASALGSYAPPAAGGSGKRRFSEMPQQSNTHKNQPLSGYRDRAAERRSLYALSSSSIEENHSDLGRRDPSRDLPLQKGAMPFPPGVGGRSDGNSNSPNYDVITADKAIEESNVGNRMLRSMGWHEGLGLGKDNHGIVEPVEVHGMDDRAGLGRHPKVETHLEAQAGDSYRTLIQKKAVARFWEMA